MEKWDEKERRNGGERRKKRVYRFMDRRDGFDRRRRYPILDVLRRQPWALFLLLGIINLFSILDGIFTVIEMSHLGVREANPVMLSFISSGPLSAIVFKVGVVLLVSLFIWYGRQLRIILELALVTATIYVALILYHLWGVFSLLLR